MPITRFPDPTSATEDGLLAVGGDLHPKSLLLAYSQGIFPWPMPAGESPDSLVLAWFCPPERAILRFDELHIPRSLAKARRKSGLRFSWDEAFEQVILACAEAPRPGQRGTWISPEMLEAYARFHRLGHAHSVEVWRDDQLVGGVYGVLVGGVFSAESMFHREPNASKLALLELVDRLRALGLEWMDIQVMTPHMKALGAREISRDLFLKSLHP